MNAVKEFLKQILFFTNTKLKKLNFSFIKNTQVTQDKHTSPIDKINPASLEEKSTNKTQVQNNEPDSNKFQAINKVADLLLNSDLDTFETNLYQSMKIMADATDVDRVYIWKNHEKNGKLYCTQKYEWSGTAKPQQGQDITIDIAYDNISGWEETLSNNQCINNIVRKMSVEEQNQLSPQDILSILVVPVFIKDRFWGFVGFDDCHKEQIFSKEDEDILRSGSNLIANALRQNEMTLALKNASKAKSDFVATMSHEFRNPLHAIINYAELGYTTDDIPHIKHALTQIKKASHFLLHLINENLEVAKIEAGKLELSPKEFIMKDIIQNIISIIEYSASLKKLTLSINIDSNIPPLIGDDYKLSQVINNLLSNAIKFTPENGNISLDVRMIAEEDDICNILFSVTDSGIGISPKQQAKLFNPYEQAEADTERTYGGTGLGLTISKKIVEKMGGKIWIESEEGKGAQFNFTTLLKKNKNYTNEEKNAFDKEEHFDFNGYTVLVVEDNEINREIAEYTLGNVNLQVVCAPNGKEALDIFAAEPEKFDLIFMDIQMPVMNGYEATTLIRKLDTPKAQDIPIIAMTGNASPKDAEYCKSIGMNDHVAKPFEPRIIYSIIKKYLKEKDPIPPNNLTIFKKTIKKIN